MQNISLDIAQSGVAQTLLFKQGDVNRSFQVTVMENGEPYPVESAEMVSVWYSGSSGEGIYTDAGEESACTVDGNVITVKVLAPLVIKKGAGTLCLMLSHPDGTQLGLWNIIYHVEGVPGYESPEAMNYYNALGRLIEKNRQQAEELRQLAEEIRETGANIQTDPSLTVQGAPAGAYEVGLRLDELLAGQVLDTSLSYEGYPADACAVGEALKERLLCEEDKYEHGSFRVSEYMRWLNPGMNLSREYQTIYRHMGSVVYVMLVNCGTLPNAGVKNMTTSIPAGSEVVSYEFVVSGPGGGTVFVNPCKIDGKELTLMTYDDSTCVTASVTTQGDLTQYSAKCLIKYTKD